MEVIMIRTWMIFFLYISIPFIFIHARSDGGVCAEEKLCRPGGPAVRFPFRLLKKHPENCSYSSGYNLHCDELNRTILELPSSTSKVEVTGISYSSRSIRFQTSLETCFAQQFRHLDISATPFEFVLRYPMYGFVLAYHINRYSLFDCPSPEESDRSGFDCLVPDGNYVKYDVYSHELSTRLESCTKMYDTKLVPDAFFSDNWPSSMNLSWPLLPGCRRCEEKGGICSWKNTSAAHIACWGEEKSGILKVLQISGPIIGCFLLVPVISAIMFAFAKMEQQKQNQQRIVKFLEDYAAMKPTRYSYADLKNITNDFKDKLGEGGYAKVYKGKISSKLYVAVKLLHTANGNGDEFINEVGTIGTIHHVNVVRLLGFCADGYHRALVYEFLPNGSLDKFIFPDSQKRHTLGMEKLQNIAVGIARGIEYLHRGCQQRILHFDIKPHNILLDEKFNPKVSDFGLSKLCEKGRSAVSMTAARGTMGYIAPEVFSRQFGNVSYKSDIYSFGVLLLEMVGRRKNIDTTVENTSQVYFPEWLYEQLANGEEFRIQIEKDEDDEVAKRLAIVGLWCIQWNPTDRPSITSVLQMLQGNGDDLCLPSNPFSSRRALKPADPNEHKGETITGLAVISELE